MAVVIYVRHSGCCVKGNRVLREQGSNIGHNGSLRSAKPLLSLQSPCASGGLEMARYNRPLQFGLRNKVKGIYPSTTELRYIL